MNRLAKLTHSGILLVALLIGSHPFETVLPQHAWKSGIVKSEFIFEKAPFAECHASTIAETNEGLVVAFFGGKGEKSRRRNLDQPVRERRMD